MLQVRDQEVWCRCGELGGLDLVSGLGSEFVEGSNGVRTGAASQDQGIRALPELETGGIDDISLDRLGEAFSSHGDIRSSPASPGPQTRLT